MKKTDIRSNVVYKNKKTRDLGVKYLEYDYGCLSDDEVGIVYRGEDNNPKQNNSFFIGTDPNDLEEYNLKQEDILNSDYIEKVCKIGQGEDCCCYLVMKSEGLSCARVDGAISIAITIKDKVKNRSIEAKAMNCGGRYNSVKLENLRNL